MVVLANVIEYINKKDVLVALCAKYFEKYKGIKAHLKGIDILFANIMAFPWYVANVR